LTLEEKQNAFKFFILFVRKLSNISCCGQRMEGEEGCSFVWWQPPPDAVPYFEHCRDKFYDFERNLCLPKTEGDFRLESTLGKFVAERRKLKGTPPIHHPHLP
jgi:hypothetical protein